MYRSYTNNNTVSWRLATDSPELEKPFSPFILNLYRLFLVFVAVPIKLPMGISVTSGLFFILALEVLTRRSKLWARTGTDRWVVLGFLFIYGMVVSFAVHLLFGNTEVEMSTLILLARYVYWVFLFVIITKICSNLYMAKQTAIFLGLGAILLVLLRIFEAVLAGGWGGEGHVIGWGTDLYTKNMYGFQFSTLGFFVLFLVFFTNFRYRVFTVLGVVMLIVAIIGNASRGNWVAVAVGLLASIAVFFVGRPQNRFRNMLLIVAILSLSFLVALGSSATGEVFGFQLQTFNDLEDDESVQFRQVMVEKSLRLLDSNLLFGAGFDQFRRTEVSGLYIPPRLRNEDFITRTAHNSYLFHLAENGLLGSVGYIALLFALAVSGFRAANKLVRQGHMWAVATYCGFVGMSVHLWVATALGSTITWLMYGLLAGVINISNQQTVASDLTA